MFLREQGVIPALQDFGTDTGRASNIIQNRCGNNGELGLKNNLLFTPVGSGNNFAIKILINNNESSFYVNL